jgi:large subunit ribosomal protein L35
LRHILTKKSTSRKRSLRSPDLIEKADVPMVKRMLPYS